MYTIYTYLKLCFIYIRIYALIKMIQQKFRHYVHIKDARRLLSHVNIYI